MGWLRNAANDGPGDIHTLIGTILPAVALTYPVTYTEIGEPTFDPADPAGGTTTAANFAVQGFVDDDIEEYKAQGVIANGDRAVLLTQKSCRDVGLILGPSISNLNAKVTARGATSTVKDIGQDPAEALWVLGVVGTESGGPQAESLIFPNMTTTEMSAVASPSAGMIIFNTTIGEPFVYTGTAWVSAIDGLPA